MTITFQNDGEVIVHALKRIISYAQNNQYIFMTQSVWWIPAIIDLQQRLVIYIDNLKVQGNVGKAAAVSDTQHIQSTRLARLWESRNEVGVWNMSQSVPPKPISIMR